MHEPERARSESQAAPSQLCGLGLDCHLFSMCHLNSGLSWSNSPTPIDPICQPVPTTANLVATWELPASLKVMVVVLLLQALVGPPGLTPHPRQMAPSAEI